MKTNVIMTRKMGGFDVLQRTSDGYFDANVLLKQWKDVNGGKKDVSEFLNLKQTKEFCDTIQMYEPYREKSGTDIQYVAYIENKGRFSKTGRTSNKTWMHPYLFIDFAMWINPKFKYDVIKFVYDELIKNRHIAGDNYKLLSATASIFPDCNYAQLGKGLNWIVFNRHAKDIRNNASDSQLDELHKLEEKLCFAVDMGLINSFPQLIETMRKMWREKWCRF